MSYRLQVTIADDIADELERRAEAAGQPSSRVAAALINLALTDHTAKRNITTARSPAAISARPTRPPWLEPHDPAERRIWRGELWAAVLALSTRYPQELHRLEAEWWRRPAGSNNSPHSTHGASRSTRPASDPREELAFQPQLADLHNILEHLPGGTDTFQRGPPPHEWLNPTYR